MSFTNISSPFLPINYYPMRTSISAYDVSHHYYLPQTHQSFNTMNPLKQSLVANYLTWFDSLVQNFASTLLTKGNMNLEPEIKYEEELSQENLNLVENESFCKLEADNDSKASKLIKKKQPSIKRLKPKPEVQKKIKTESKKKFWLPAEDALVLDLMKVYGQKWTMISTFLQDRTGKQVRDRYLNHLRPTIDQRDWNDEEDGLLKKLAVELEHRWTVIAAKLDGRTENQVKNRYHTLLRRDKREMKQKRRVPKTGVKLEDLNEVDQSYEELVFQPKIESNLTCESEEDFKKSENEPWNYAFYPLKYHPNNKVETTDSSLISADCPEREEITNFLDQNKFEGSELTKFSSNNWTKRQIMNKEEEELNTCFPVKKIKFSHDLTSTQTNEVKEKFL